MLKGQTVSLRPLAEDELDTVHRHIIDLASRGPWYPMPTTSLAKFRAGFSEAGYWTADDGFFVIVDGEERLVGDVQWGKLNGSAPDVEVSYRVYDAADRGRGIATEAVDLLSAYLFDAYPMNRLLLYIHVDNVASSRVAEKAGFTKEATAREAWPHKGRWHDLDIFTLTRAESAARRAG